MSSLSNASGTPVGERAGQRQGRSLRLGPGMHAGEQVVEHGAQRVEVAGHVELVLGRPVVQRGGMRLGQTAEAQVRDLDHARRDHDVRRLDRSVDQALAVDEGQRLRDHAPQAVHLLDLQLVPRAQRLREALARDELRHHAALPVDLDDAEDLDQVRMGEAGGGLEVGHQGLQDSRAAQQRGGQHPQRDVAAVALLLGAEDRAQRAARRSAPCSRSGGGAAARAARRPAPEWRRREGPRSAPREGTAAAGAGAGTRGGPIKGGGSGEGRPARTAATRASTSRKCRSSAWIFS